MTPSNPVREVLLVMEQELRAMLLSARAIFLAVIYAGSMASAFWAALKLWRGAKSEIASQLAKQNGGMLDPSTLIDKAIQSDQFKGWLDEEVIAKASALGPEVEYAAQALRDGSLPWAVAVGLVVSATILPPLMLMISYDRISGDLSIKYTRYLLQRIRRGSYIVGKLLGQWVVILGVVFVVQAGLLMLGSGVPELAMGPILATLPKVWFGFSLLLLAYLSFFTIFSALFDRPFLALMVGGTAHFFITTFAFTTSLREVWIGRWDFRVSLLEPVGIAVALAHVGLFIGIAYFFIRRRDV